MTEKTKTCEELIKSGDESPCIIRIQEDVKHIKEDFSEFQRYYKEAHLDLVSRVNTTNGHIAAILIWKERITGATLLLVSFGIVNWIGKYIITYLEK
jgi:hypothetical protein